MWVDDQATMSSIDVALHHATVAKRKEVADLDHHLHKLRATHAHSKPVEWRSKRYRRAEAAGDEEARKTAERRERKKWATKVFNILVDSCVPFGAEASSKNLGPLSPVAACEDSEQPLSRRRPPTWRPFSSS